MDNRRFDWNLIKSFLAVLDAGTLSGAAAATGTSQPTLGRHIDELEALTGLVLFGRGRSGMTATPNALALAEEARAMQAGANGFAMAAAGRETAVEGTIRITASEVVSTFLLPEILVALADEEPALEIELVASDSVQNLLARDADIAVRMVRPVQNDLITRKVNDAAMGAFAHRDYLEKHGTPREPHDLFSHRVIGQDRDDLILRGMARLGIRPDRSAFTFRTDHPIASWNLVLAGAGIGFMQVAIANRSSNLVRVLPELDIEPLPYWLCSHRELRHSARVRRVYDFLAERLAALPLGGVTS
jgi:DNA-binding transcriptional LysR family regulator